MTPEEGAGWWQAWISPALAGLKEFLSIASWPGAALFGGGLFNLWQTRRRERMELDKQKAAEQRAEQDRLRADQEKRDAAFWDKFERADVQVKQHVQWLNDRAERAEKRADDAETRADAAERETRRLELYVERHEHALANARQVADDARAAQGKPALEWKPVPRPRLPGDPA